MDGEGDGTVQTEDGDKRMERDDGGTSPSKEDRTSQGREVTPTPEEGVQTNDEESIASTETTLTTKADREVRELMKSVIDSSESIGDQSSVTQDGSEATEIHVPDLDVSFDQSESGSVVWGQKTDQSENGSVFDTGVDQSEYIELEIENIDQSDNGSVVEIVPAQENDSIREAYEPDSAVNEVASSTNFADNADDNDRKVSISDQSDTGSSTPKGGSDQENPKEAESPVLITPQPDGTVSPTIQVNDGNIFPEKSSQDNSEVGDISPRLSDEEMSQKGAMPDSKLQERSGNGTPLQERSESGTPVQERSESGTPVPERPESGTPVPERSESGTPLSLQSQEIIQDGQGVDQQSLNSVSNAQLEEYDSMSSFNQHADQKEEDQRSQDADGNTSVNMKANEYISSETKDGDGDKVDDGMEDKRKEISKEMADESEEEDSSQFAQLIVQHVLGHAVSSFNESDTSLHDDTTEAGSSTSLPADGGVKPKVNSLATTTMQAAPIQDNINPTFYGSTGPPIYQTSGTEVNVSQDKSGREFVARSLAEFQIDSINLEDSSGGSGLELPKRSNITLDSEMENETFDISMVSGESTQTDNPEGVLSGKGTAPRNTSTVEDTMSDTDCRPPGLRTLAPALASYPEFPENYGNYQVCRTVGPDEKECLILETGENVTVKRNAKIPKSGKQMDTVNSDRFVSQNPNSGQFSRIPLPSDGTSKSLAERPGTGPVYTSIPREDEEIHRNPVSSGKPVIYNLNHPEHPSALMSQQHGKPDRDFNDDRHVGYNGNLSAGGHGDPYKNQMVDSRVDHKSKHPVDQGDGRDYNRYASTSQDHGRSITPGHPSYHGNSARIDPQFLNSEIFQDPISIRLSQNSKGSKRVDHRILQSSSLYAPNSGLTNLNSNMLSSESHGGQSSRSLNDMGPDRQPAAPQFRLQLQSDRPCPDASTQNRGPLITEEDLQRYNVNFTDPGAYQRYQQVLARENSTGETYANFTSDPYHGQTAQQEQTLELVDSIYNRVLRNEAPRHRNQLPQGAFEGSYLDTRNDSNGDLTEKERALLSRIYQEYGASHLSASVPQWSGSLTNGQSVPSSNEVSMSTPSSGPIPTFKTLQEQQTSWMQMFQTLEERHEQEMKHQQRQHKDNIFEMQQRMENELFDQQQQLKHKLKAHKKALEDSSFNSTVESQPPDTYRSETSKRSSDRSPYASPRQNRDEKSPRQTQSRDSKTHHREHSPSWREIYHEVRQSLDDPLPVRRSLDGEFIRVPKESPSQRTHSSPPRLTTPPRTRSPERPRSPRPKSPPRSRLQRSRSPPMSRSSRNQSPPRSRSPERRRSPPRSRSPEGRRSPPRSRSSERRRSPPRSRSPEVRSRSPKARSPPRVRSRSPPASRSFVEIMNGDAGDVPPRAGVYSSPMPIRRGKGGQTKVSSSAHPSTPPRNKEIYPLIVSPSMSEKRQSSVLQRELEDRHRERVEQQDSFNSELFSSSTLSDDVHLSSSTRVGLREKHAKHMADLREYYEKELQGLRQALRASDNDTVSGHQSLQHFVSENESLHRELKQQREKVADLEDKLNMSDRRNYDVEQKIKALEARAAEYADFYKEAQDKISTFRSTVEELQYRMGQKDDLLEQLRAENNAHKNNLKKAKKVQEDQATYIHRDRTALEKLVEQYQANERERTILKESVNDLENKMYDTRTENVEMKRTITKLELENKRLGRENDNLHHKISQGISHNISGSIYTSLNDSLAVQQEALALDHRQPSPRRQPSNPTPTNPSKPHADRVASLLHADNRSPVRSQPLSAPYADSNGLNNSVHQSPEACNVLNGSFHRSEDTRSVRTPPRNTRSQAERDGDLINVTSPVMRAEEELYRLRDVLRNSPTPSREPTQPKLQKKKFYGSDVVTQSQRKDMSPDRQSDSLKVKKKSTPSSPLVKSSKHSKLESTNSKSKSSRKTTQTIVKDQSGKEDFSSQTRFDINSDSHRSRSPGDGHPNGVVWTNKKPPGGEHSNVSRVEDRKKKKEAVEPAMTVDAMLDRVRAGDYLSRPDWEDKYTSMVPKPKAAPASPRQPTSREDRIRERLKSIGDLEHRYADLNSEKRQLESALSRLPSHGKSRKRKEELEDNLDKVERELGSVRMSLKRYNVLKSTI